MCCVGIEVPLWIFEGDCVNALHSCNKVSLDSLVGVCYVSAFVFSDKFCTRLCHVRNTDILLACLIVLICLRENVHKDEMMVSADKISLGISSFHVIALNAIVFSLNLIESLQCVVGCCYGIICAFPDA